MRTKVFAHKGVVGIMSDINAEGLLNNPTDDGQLGFVVNAEFVDIQPEALEILKTIPKSHDSLGDVDIFQASRGMVVFSWLGGHLAIIHPTSGITGSREYNPSLLTPCDTVETDPDFARFVDSISED